MSSKNKNPSTPDQPFEPIVIVSREGLTAAVSHVVQCKLKHVKRTAQMEEEMAKIRREYADELADLERAIATHEAGIQVYAAKMRKEIFPGDRKSLDLQCAVIGFRQTPCSVEKLRSRDTWPMIALRLQGYIDRGPVPEGAPEGTEGPVIFNGRNFVRLKDPELNKDLLIEERKTIPAHVLAAVGIKFEEDEIFYLTPNSEVAEATKS